MIRVTNKAEKRVFSDKETDEISYLKDKVILEIQNIENSDFNYNKLAKFIYYKGADNLSVFFYRKKMIDVLNSLEQNTSEISSQLRAEFSYLKKNSFLLLIGRFDKIKLFINSLSGNSLLLIHRKKNKSDIRKDGYVNYKEAFEGLFKAYLSNTTSNFKKPFFKLFKEINVCPYCNRNFVNPINKEITIKVVGAHNNQSPDIEHFFPKSIYPFLSLSISNLLPSCAFCNKIKSDVDTFTQNCISPYEIIENDTRFRFEFDSINMDTRKINFICTDGIKNSEVLHLNNLYNEVHSDYVNDMFTKLKKYPDVNKKFLKDEFNLNEEDYKKEFCNYFKEADFNKHPLSKMTKDLYEHIKSYGK